MATLSEIEKLAKEFSEVRENLKAQITDLEREISSIKKRFLPGIRRLAERTAQWHQKLFNAISESKDLFIKPKTMIFHGIKLGWMKSKGDIAWKDTDQVVSLIKKHFPDQVDTLIKVTEVPIKTALAQLSASDLKKIGVMVIETEDQVFIKPTDSEIDRMIKQLLKDEEISA